MILHIISSNSIKALQQCLQMAADNDVLLFIENGVYLHDANTSEIKQTCFYLHADIAARGIEHNTTTQLVDDAGFVDLVCSTDKSVSWYA
jgi:sulfur relay protein TusB/DsrH